MKPRNFAQNIFNIYTKVIYNLPRGYSPLPPLIIWETTRRCNLKCKMCVFYGLHSVKPDVSAELSIEDFKNALDNIKASYLYYPYKPFLGFTGGELFLRTDIFDILTYAKKLGFEFSITTNFSLINEQKAIELLNLNPADIRVSLDGPAKIHDEIRGYDGLYNKIISSIKWIKKNNKYIPFKLNCVINSTNIDHLTDMVQVAKELSADLSFQHIQFSNNKLIEENKKVTKKFLGIECTPFMDMQSLSIEDTKKLILKIDEVKTYAKSVYQNLYFIPNLDNSEIYNYYQNMNFKYSEKCTYPYGAVRIDPKGNIYQCMDNYYYGNIKTEKFSNVFNNENAKRFRLALKKVKLYPGCLRCCKL